MLMKEKIHEKQLQEAAIMPPSERTPLIATVRVAPPRQRYTHNVLRRFCTIALSSTLLAFLLVFLATVAFHPPRDGHGHRPHDDDRHRWSWPGWSHRKVSYEKLKEILLETPDSKLAEEWSRYYTSGAHMAGQNYSQVCLP